jgi:hypothetical protein
MTNKQQEPKLEKQSTNGHNKQILYTILQWDRKIQHRIMHKTGKWDRKFKTE